MIRNFKHRGLRELFRNGTTRRVKQDQQDRILRRLDVLNQAESLDELNIPGFYFHKLQVKPVRFSIRVTGNWRITFGWEEEPFDVDLEDYH